jgi:xanthine dehydrogenase accessory factor
MSPVRILETTIRECDAGKRVALCVVVATRGSTPQPAGTMLCLDETAKITGTLGGGCVEADVRRRAHQSLSTRHSELLTFALDNDFGFDDGMICGGQMDIAVRVLSPSDELSPLRSACQRLGAGESALIPIQVAGKQGLLEYRIHLEAEPKLVIVGAGHISRVLADMMVPLGFAVNVIDDRSDYANADRFPPPIRTTAGAIEKTLRSWPMDANTFIAIVTRGHKHDEQALRAVIESPAKYVGMIGSRRKIKVIFDDLRHAGVSDARLETVHAPIGLDIRSVTTHEIALSIAAELVSVRRANGHRAVEGPIHISTEST